MLAWTIIVLSIFNYYNRNNIINQNNAADAEDAADAVDVEDAAVTGVALSHRRITYALLNSFFDNTRRYLQYMLPIKAINPK